MQRFISYRLRFVAPILLFLAILGCEKDEVTTLPIDETDKYALIDENGNKGFYYYDEQPIVPAEFDSYYTPGLTIILGAGAQTKHGQEEIHFHSFSTLEKYFDFSDRNNANAREYYAYDQKIEALNLELDIENTYHDNPQVQKEYHSKVEELYLSLPPELRGDAGQNHQKLVVRLYKDCVPFPGNGNDGSFRPGLNQIPFMPFGLNNKVSMFGRLSIAGLNFIYDKSFYRRRLAVITTLGFETIAFCPGQRFFPLNDKMSSGSFI